MSFKTKLGICWFQPEQWDQAKALFVDGETLGDGYDSWRKTTSAAISQLRAAGGTPIKVAVDLDELSQWCSDQQLAVNVSSCSQFVKVIMERQQKG